MIPFDVYVLILDIVPYNIYSVLLYATEAATLNEKQWDRLEAAEM